MQHVNDDMDELFRRAADGYPLKTDSADWNSVVKKIESQRSEQVKEPRINKNYKQLLWLLLLLPLGLYETTILNNKFHDKNVNAIKKESKNIIKQDAQTLSFFKKSEPKLNTVKLFTIPQQKSSVLVNSSVIQRKSKGKLHSNIVSGIASVFSPDTKPLITVNEMNELDQQKEIVNNTGNENTEIAKNETTAIQLKDKKEGDQEIGNQQEQIKNAQKTIHLQKEHGLYAGISIGPDVSTVKLQSVKNIGINIGFLFGYQINNRFSIETGLSWNVKSYYSDGKYFNTKNITLPAYASIQNVEGKCHMIEFPMNVKYNLTGGKNKFFIGAGISSYFMKKEYYDYTIERNGRVYPRSATYNNSTNNLFSVANISIGYNKLLKHNIAFRIEPYIKIPIKGVGIGRLPIMSTGLNITITKKIF